MKDLAAERWDGLQAGLKGLPSYENMVRDQSGAWLEGWAEGIFQWLAKTYGRA